MIKILFAGIWVAALLSGSVLFFSGMKSDEQNKDGKESAGAYFGDLDFVKIDPMSISMLREGSVSGYLLLSAGYTIDQKMVKDMVVPLEYIFKDIILSSIYKNEDMDLLKLGTFDTDKFQEQLLKDLNERLGKKVVHEVLVMKLEFMSIEDVRDMQMKRS
ncbi:MAG: hypothetical protein AB8B49_10540 [Nitratireductor sp.]